LVNIAKNNHQFGIHLYNCDYNNITGNIANDNSNIGMGFFQSNSSIVSGNTANNNDESGIFLYESNDNIISGNTANDNNWYGISLKYSNNTIISGNTLIGNDECIVEENCQGNRFSDNGDCTYGQGDGKIPGYNLFFLLGIISVVAIIISKKVRKQ